VFSLPKYIALIWKNTIRELKVGDEDYRLFLEKLSEYTEGLGENIKIKTIKRRFDPVC
jgi:hypothetical protein